MVTPKEQESGTLQTKSTRITRVQGMFSRRATPYLDGEVEHYLYSTHPERLRHYGRRVLIYNEMRQDAVIRTIIDGLKVPLLASPFRITAGGSDAQSKAMAEFMERAIGMTDDTALDISWGQHVEEMLRFIEFGYSMAERVLMKYEDGEVGLKELNYLPPVRMDWSNPWIVNPATHRMVGVRQHLNYNNHPTSYWNSGVGGSLNAEVPYYKVIHCIYQQRDRQPDGESLLSALWRDWKNRVELEDFEQVGVEHDTGGTPVLYPPHTIDNVEAQKYLKQMEDIRLGAQMGIVMPGPKQGTKFDEQNIAEPGWLLESYQGKATNNGARDIIRDLDRRMFERAFMQWIKMGSGSGGGSFALARTTMDYFLLHLKQVQNNLLVNWQRNIIRYLYTVNQMVGKWPQAECPSIQWSLPGLQDLPTITQAYLDLTQLGVITPTDADQKFFRASLTLPAQEEGTVDLPILAMTTGGENGAKTVSAGGTSGRTGSPNRRPGNVEGEPQTNRIQRDRPPADGK